jgi:hypothetical protein
VIYLSSAVAVAASDAVPSLAAALLLPLLPPPLLVSQFERRLAGCDARTGSIGSFNDLSGDKS